MTASARRARGPILLLATTLALLVLTGCGGGFSSTPPPERETTIESYVALGDGFAAAPYTGTTESADGCLRSTSNYATQVATALKVTDFKDVSCVGAVTRSITSTFTTRGVGKKVPGQLAAVTKDTDLITLSIGIEDADLLRDMFRVCPSIGGECPAGLIPGNEFVTRAEAFSEALPRAISAIQDRAPQAFIVVVGYPTLAPVEGTCKGLPPMSQQMLDLANRVMDGLNQSIRGSARQVGAAYVDAVSLGDHNICSKDPWMTGRTGVKGKSVAFHPVAAEQKALAEAIVTQVERR